MPPAGEKKTWKCGACGYTAAALLPPVKCPKCRAGWQAFAEA
jgi:rubrerythrin